jgi:hypothetical protein
MIAESAILHYLLFPMILALSSMKKITHFLSLILLATSHLEHYVFNLQSFVLQIYLCSNNYLILEQEY